MDRIRLYRLRNEHRRLDNAIRREECLEAPDTERLQDLKRRRLALKGQMFLAEAGLSPVRF
ncbi:MAG: YdcH family protein [Phenylobacterium sp.]|jgi:hypothetical protein|uniref:YdcH family protein n=1 Tax=Phenylobacterium sp. TaxID=1871053 RepID=UPI002734A8BC|nr:YdcH family protein [Phenylobacterium sp.]MDP1642193.1 YdcH family protein [Phenylobacterium sp.]MDP3117060.1 YdcH family protein [Phenylobacterium sp.]MDP3384462.1 YdcH family protein [Phenylobacterium sp.]MDZ4055099.1 YdcH family protein [Phenylobacterium sp.]MDZ4320395.1 YdcH family protein [Phenylobacterium sp.]